MMLDEAAAVHAAMRRALPGDLVVVCADDAVGVYREALALAAGPRAGWRSRIRGSWRHPGVGGTGETGAGAGTRLRNGGRAGR